MNKQLEKQAFEWAKKNRKKVVKEILSKYDSENFKWKQVIFLSWSPWAWKTEVINWMMEDWFQKYFLHIDLDELRKIIPWYKWGEADSFQSWAIKIMEMLLDETFKRGINIILDWTFWSKKVSWKNIKKAIQKWYDIKIYYIKFDPMLAWKFTLWRELEQKRKVPFFSFYKQYYFSYFNIKRTIKNSNWIELKVFDKKFWRSWLFSKIYTIQSHKDFKKQENNIKPNFNFIYLFFKLSFLTIKYKFFVKKWLLPNDINYEQENTKRN